MIQCLLKMKPIPGESAEGSDIPAAVKVEVLLRRARALRRQIKGCVTDRELRQMKQHGRGA